MNDNINITIIKRSGQHVDFDAAKIALAIKKSFDSTDPSSTPEDVNMVFKAVCDTIATDYADRKTIAVEDIQDLIEKKLFELGYTKIAKSFKDYREARAASRKISEQKNEHKFLRTVEKLSQSIEGAETRAPFESVLHYGKIVAREQARAFLVGNKYIRAHDEGEIYIHNIACLGLGAVSEVAVDALNVTDEDFIFTLGELLSGLNTEVSSRIKIFNFDKAVQNYELSLVKTELFDEISSRLEDNGVAELVDIENLSEKIDGMSLAEVEKSDFGACLLNKVTKNSLFAVKNRVKKQVRREVFQMKKRLVKLGGEFHFVDSVKYNLVIAETSVNLPRIALETKNMDDFLSSFDVLLDFAKNELIDSYNYLGNRVKGSYKYLFNREVLPEAMEIERDQRIRKVLRSGVLKINLVGLAEAQRYFGTGLELVSRVLEVARTKAERFSVAERVQIVIEEADETNEAAEYFLDIDKAIFGDEVLFSSYNSYAFSDFENKKSDHNVAEKTTENFQKSSNFKNGNLDNNIYNGRKGGE